MSAVLHRAGRLPLHLALRQRLEPLRVNQHRTGPHSESAQVFDIEGGKDALWGPDRRRSGPRPGQNYGAKSKDYCRFGWGPISLLICSGR